MNATNKPTVSAETVLSSLNPAHIPTLDQYYENKIRSELLAELTKTLGGNVVTANADADADATPATDEAPAQKRGRGRPRKNPESKEEPSKRKPGRPRKNPESTEEAKAGPNRSQLIRDHYSKYPEASVADVISYLEKKGLACTPPLVYAVRAKVDADNAAAEKAAKKAAAKKVAKKAATKKAAAKKATAK